jgi:hypothetical protein
LLTLDTRAYPTRCACNALPSRGRKLQGIIINWLVAELGYNAG